MKKNLEKKVIMLHGNFMEIGQGLTTLFGLNPDIVVYHHFSTIGIRQAQTGSIMMPGQSQQAESISIIYLVYSNPGEIVGFPNAEQPVKANLKGIKGEGEIN